MLSCLSVCVIVLGAGHSVGKNNWCYFDYAAGVLWLFYDLASCDDDHDDGGGGGGVISCCASSWRSTVASVLSSDWVSSIPAKESSS